MAAEVGEDGRGQDRRARRKIPYPGFGSKSARNDGPMIWRVIGLTSFALWFASAYSDLATQNGLRSLDLLRPHSDFHASTV